MTDGLTASQNNISMLEEKDPEKRVTIGEPLLEYCERDTQGMVALKDYLLNVPH
mgnify:CR=1 FL=1|jgi:hypothetical protein